MEAIENLVQQSDSMRQAAADLLNNEDVDRNSSSSSRCASTFLNVVVLGNTGAGKSAVLNSLIGHPVLPTGENGATRAPICIDLDKDEHLSNKIILQQIDGKTQSVSASDLRHSLQDRLGKISRTSRDEIYLKLKTSTAPPLKLIDLPGVDKWNPDHSLSEYAKHNDAILLVIIPAAQAPEVSSAKALKIAKAYDAECTRTIGVISKVDQTSADPRVLAACQALLLGQGPRSAADIPFVAVTGQSVSIAYAQFVKMGLDNSLETKWLAESESLKSILTGAPQSKLGRLALVETLAYQIRSQMKNRLPSLLSGLQGKSQIVQDELVRLEESVVSSSEGTLALALELCHEFEDKFLQHIMTGEENIQNEHKRIQENESCDSSSVDDIDVLKHALSETCGYIQGVGDVVRSATPNVSSTYLDLSQQQWREQMKELQKQVQQVNEQVNEHMRKMQEDFQKQLEQMRQDFQRRDESD